jgi:hypothetical protein
VNRESRTVTTWPPGSQEAIADLEREARIARAELRQLERDTGQAASADGAYWLARTAALEHVAATAQHAVATGDLEPLVADLQQLRSVRAPACNVNDHAGA